jgi:hypothetical protein
MVEDLRQTIVSRKLHLIAFNFFTCDRNVTIFPPSSQGDETVRLAPFIQVRGFPGDQRRSGCLILQGRGFFVF